MKSRNLLLSHVEVPGIDGLDGYMKHGGYDTLKKALKSMSPDDVVEEVLE